MKLLLFAGAGTSVELGVPAMRGLATEFVSHSEQWNIEPELVKRILGDEPDVEVLIENLDKVCSAQDSLRAFSASEQSLDRFETIRAEVEWFVQHAAERIAAPDAYLMWGSILRTAQVHELTLVTTNYDRAIELAANAEHLSLNDGFNAFANNEVTNWSGLARLDGKPQLVKLHGSTDWYADSATGDPLKLRHPMPLFGRSTLRLSNDTRLGSALVLPSREKLLNRAPYPRLSQAFLNAADTCDVAVFVGSSLRDVHIREAASTIAKNRHLFIVNPNGELFGITQAHSFNQPASLFLISTLPNALSQSDPVATLVAASTNSQKVNHSIFQDLCIAMNSRESTERRCHAIELLDESSVTLDKHLIRSLLLDGDPVVSRYALGLVATSQDRGELLSVAQNTSHKTDNAYAEELGLLDKLAEQSR